MELTPLMERWRLRGGQATRVPHGNGHGAGEQVAGAQGIRSGHAGHGAVQLLKGAVQRHLGGLAHAEIGGISGGEFQRQQHFGAVADDGDLLPAGHLSPLATFRVLTVPSTSARTYWRSTTLS